VVTLNPYKHNISWMAYGLVFCLCAVTGAAQTIVTIAGDGVQGYAGDNGPAIQAQIAGEGITADRWDNVYLSEPVNHVVRRIDHNTGVITTLAGTGQQGDSGDGGPAKDAELNYPFKLAVDRAGDVYIADFGARKVRRVDHKTGVITTVAGSASSDLGDGGPATEAQLAAPTDVAFDGEDNLYIADAGHQRVRRVDRRSGIITTVVGSGINAISGGTGEGGPASEAGFLYFLSIAFGSDGDLYVSDSAMLNVRRVDRRTNIIRTVAGVHPLFVTGAPPFAFAGDGGKARDALFSYIDDITFDCEGNLTISDTFNNRIRQVNRRTGIVATIAGNGTQGFSGDGGNATRAELANPRGIAFDTHGNLLIVDGSNFRVRLVTRSRHNHQEGCFADGDRHDHHRDW
jgi:hypothetical protein